MKVHAVQAHAVKVHAVKVNAVKVHAVKVYTEEVHAVPWWVEQVQMWMQVDEPHVLKRVDEVLAVPV